MLRRLTTGLAFFSTLALTASAMAAPSPTTAPSEIRAAQSEVRGTLDAFNLNVVKERISFAKRGRRDLVLDTRADARQIVAQMKRAYRTERALPNGYRVSGWARLTATGTHTFTLTKGGHVSKIVEVADRGQRAEVKIWGTRYDALSEHRRPLSTVPRRYAPANDGPIVR